MKRRLKKFILQNLPITSEEDVERCKQRDLLEEMLIQMTGEYPSLSKVFVQERDIFLAHNLKKAAVLAFQKACFGDHAPGASKQRTPEVTNVAEYEADDDGSCDDDGGTDGDGDGGDADGDGGRSGADGDGGGGSADADGGDDNADCCGMERQDVVNCEMPVSVVGVVGIGHCPGITRMWQEEHDILELLTLVHVFVLNETPIGCCNLLLSHILIQLSNQPVILS